MAVWRLQVNTGGANVADYCLQNHGVQSSVVNLMKQTLTINVAPAAANTIASQIETIVHSHEPDVEVQEETIIPVTKSYLLKGLDCPNCSAKIEKEVGELDGVQSSVV